MTQSRPKAIQIVDTSGASTGYALVYNDTTKGFDLVAVSALGVTLDVAYEAGETFLYESNGAIKHYRPTGKPTTTVSIGGTDYKVCNEIQRNAEASVVNSPTVIALDTQARVEGVAEQIQYGGAANIGGTNQWFWRLFSNGLAWLTSLKITENTTYPLVALTVANGDNDDVTLPDGKIFRITDPDAGFNISGFAGGVDGRLITVTNRTTEQMDIIDKLTSQAENQIDTNGLGDISIGTLGSFTSHYDGADQFWVLDSVHGV